MKHEQKRQFPDITRREDFLEAFDPDHPLYTNSDILTFSYDPVAFYARHEEKHLQHCHNEKEKVVVRTRLRKRLMESAQKIVSVQKGIASLESPYMKPDYSQLQRPAILVTHLAKQRDIWIDKKEFESFFSTLDAVFDLAAPDSEQAMASHHYNALAVYYGAGRLLEAGHYCHSRLHARAEKALTDIYHFSPQSYIPMMTECAQSEPFFLAAAPTLLKHLCAVRQGLIQQAQRCGTDEKGMANVHGSMADAVAHLGLRLPEKSGMINSVAEMFATSFGIWAEMDPENAKKKLNDWANLSVADIVRINPLFAEIIAYVQLDINGTVVPDRLTANRTLKKEHLQKWQPDKLALRN